MKLPADYRAAKRALLAIKDLKEAKTFRDKAVGLEAYAYQAKDSELIAYAAEYRKRAERKVGELIEQLPKAKGGAEKGVGRRGKNAGPQATRIQTLEKQGVDKHLADRARKAWRMPADKFEALIRRAVKIAVAAVMNNAEVIKAARAERHATKKAHRQKREQNLADKLLALPAKKYAVILADPEWKFEFYSELGLTNSSAENHYPTSTLDEIKRRDVQSIAADDCVLWLWATVPMLPHALEVMQAWGFTYKSNFCWIKDRHGTGYWNRNKHEILLIGTRGKIPAPADGDQRESAILASVGEHSAKPVVFHELIEAYFPTVPKIELNRRGPARPGWDAWGLEASNGQQAPLPIRVTESDHAVA